MRITYAPTSQPFDAVPFLQDSIDAGIIELCPNSTAPTSEIYRLYLAWENGHPVTRTALGRALGDLGSPQLKGTNGRRLRGGIKILVPGPGRP